MALEMWEGAGAQLGPVVEARIGPGSARLGRNQLPVHPALVLELVLDARDLRARHERPRRRRPHAQQRPDCEHSAHQNHVQYTIYSTLIKYRIYRQSSGFEELKSVVDWFSFRHSTNNNQ